MTAPMTIVRLDRFTMPLASREALLARIAATHAVLRDQPGFVADAILERQAAEGTEVVTYAEWSDEAAVVAARVAVAAWQAAAGFDRAEFLDRLGITADCSTLTRVSPPATGSAA